MTNKVPRHPERVCWGCDKACPADDLGCANGTVRTQHPAELFGDDWLDWIASRERPAIPSRAAAPDATTTDAVDQAPITDRAARQ